MRNIVPQVKPSVILVVDDEADTRAVISLSLSKDGHQSVEARDGQEALECCRASLPDMIITDLMMPRIDGNEFVKRFREEFSDHYIPILVLTAKDEVEEKVKGLSSGADDYLTKPFNYRELLARVQALLRTKVLTERLYARSMELEEANQELSRVQDELVRKERQLVAMQFAGATAHSLGQPITTILLQCRLLEQNLGEKEAELSASLDDHTQSISAVQAIKRECEEIRETLSKLKVVDPSKTQNYIGDVTILDLENS